MPWQVGSSPTPDQVEWVRREQQLFASEQWAGVVGALGATPAFGWHSTKSLGVMIPVFKVFGARIGYLGFPVAGPCLDGFDDGAVSELARAAISSLGLDMVRAVRSVGRDPVRSSTSILPEARISDLQAWRPEDKRLRRDLAFARRRARAMPVDAAAESAGACFDLYRKTVEGRGGIVRYTPEYFTQLIAMSSPAGPVRVLTATGDSGALVGFAAVARSGATAYYMHGAVSSEGKASGISDLLVLELVAHARALGCEAFSLMASPWAQPGLTRFKLKWGNEPGLVETSDYAAKGAGWAIRAYSRWKGRRDRRAALAWLCEQ